MRNDWLARGDDGEALTRFLTGLNRGKQWAHAPENRERLLELWMRELEDLPELPPENTWLDRTYAQRARELASRR